MFRGLDGPTGLVGEGERIVCTLVAIDAECVSLNPIGDGVVVFQQLFDIPVGVQGQGEDGIFRVVGPLTLYLECKVFARRQSVVAIAAIAACFSLA